MTIEMQQRNDEFIAKAKARGAKTLAYKTPCCGKETESLKPPVGDTWDSLAICPFCETYYFKISTSKEITGTLFDE